MFQFLREFPTNHNKNVIIIIKCTKSCEQLDANRSRFRSEGNQAIFEELKRRITEVSELAAIMSPEVGNADPEHILRCNGDISSTDPIGALLSAYCKGKGGTIW
uniref:Uncharacterized protein n=1 Tax=Proboscia inermis TaxID=420281 RepID=A0A7S0C255_9STRA|mmetsp:Transcript_22628/g.22950  ORF Transcript_22628/g.22950 Transcript_22628/m.22950 type:complete len:104 (+) Transcript_22628:2-313(+)